MAALEAHVEDIEAEFKTSTMKTDDQPKRKKRSFDMDTGNRDMLNVDRVSEVLKIKSMPLHDVRNNKNGLKRAYHSTGTPTRINRASHSWTIGATYQ